MKSATVGSVKPKVMEGVSSPRKKEVLGTSPQKVFQGHPEKGKNLSNQGKSLSSAIGVMVGAMGGENVPLWKT